jgi:hypothetical protein
MFAHKIPFGDTRPMKILLLTLIHYALHSQTLFASSYQITKCLGQEEQQLHEKKDQGLVYKLNQSLISVFINMPKVKLKNKYYQELCAHAGKGVTMELLTQIFKNGEDLFEKDSDLKELKEQLPTLFNQYFLQLQNEAPTPDCLEKNIKGLKEFLDQLKYTEGFLSLKKNPTLISIVEKMENIQPIYELCKKSPPAEKKK